MSKAPKEPQTLSPLIAWYQGVVSDAIPVRVHNRLTDAGGAPEWHGEFRAFLTAHPKAIDKEGYVRDPLAFWLWTMHRGGPKNKRRALFLFRLAHLDFDWLEAVHARKSMSKWREDMAEDYTVASLRVLWRRMQSEPEIRVRPPKDKSDAQKDAEAAA